MSSPSSSNSHFEVPNPLHSSSMPPTPRSSLSNQGGQNGINRPRVPHATSVMPLPTPGISDPSSSIYITTSTTDDIKFKSNRRNDPKRFPGGSSPSLKSPSSSSSPSTTATTGVRRASSRTLSGRSGDINTLSQKLKDKLVVVEISPSVDSQQEGKQSSPSLLSPSPSPSPASTTSPGSPPLQQKVQSISTSISATSVSTVTENELVAAEKPAGSSSESQDQHQQENIIRRSTASPALGPACPVGVAGQQQWAASAMMNGGIASVSPDVHARILTFQQSRQSRSNSGSNSALNFTPGSIPSSLTSSPNLASLSSPGNDSTSTSNNNHRGNDLSRSSSSSSTASSYSNYSRNMSSYSSPIISPNSEDSYHSISRGIDTKGLQKQQPQQSELDSQRQPQQLPSPSLSNHETLQVKIPQDLNISTSNSNDNSTDSIAPPISNSGSVGTSITPNFSGALFVNPSASGAKLLAKKTSLSQRRGLVLSESKSSPLPNMNLGSNSIERRELTSAPNSYEESSLVSDSGSNSSRSTLYTSSNSNTITSSTISKATLTASASSLNSSKLSLKSPARTTTSSSSPNISLKPPGVGGFAAGPGNLFLNYKRYVDVKSGSLNFAGKASVHAKGIDFSSGPSFRISLDEFESMGELGRGNYGTVTKVLHKPTNVIMAMKEIRLELDETKFRQIIMELDVLHKCDSPFIVDFYGAFFVEGAVYMCMEYMDGGSLNKIYQDGVEEKYLAIIADAVVRGLKRLKDQHNIIHRDVKPTNILVSTSGKVKLCDFGVSGNLVASIARTNVGCQSYMAPERIRSKNPNEAITYTVESDIWSLGLSLLEIAEGEYPYPPETYGNIFSQLSAIVDGDPPTLSEGKYSPEARSFVAQCLNKVPRLRPSYSQLLKHPWLVNINNEMSPSLEADFGDFVKKVLDMDKPSQK